MAEENKKNSSYDDLELEAEAGAEDSGKASANEETVLISKAKIILAKRLLENIRDNNAKLIELLSVYISSDDEARISIGQMADDNYEDSSDSDSRIIEGVFDGESMIGPDGKQYSVPANYASKSKLVEGDIMKLTITNNGTFVYKQIGPIERSRVVGTIEKAGDGNFYVVADGRRWRVITASVTYFKGGAGDEAVILVPKSGESKWAAVENVVKKPAN